MEDYALRVAEWLENRIKAQERKFPQLVALKAEVNAASAAVNSATTDDEIAIALERQTRACYALISFQST